MNVVVNRYEARPTSMGWWGVWDTQDKRFVRTLDDQGRPLKKAEARKLALNRNIAAAAGDRPRPKRR